MWGDPPLWPLNSSRLDGAQFLGLTDCYWARSDCPPPPRRLTVVHQRNSAEFMHRLPANWIRHMLSTVWPLWELHNVDFMHLQPSSPPPHSQPPPLQPPLTLYCAAVRDLPQAPSSTIINQTGGREPDRRVGVECTTGPDGGGGPGHLQWGGTRSSVTVKEFLSLKMQLIISLINDYSAIDQSTVKTCSLFSHEVCKWNPQSNSLNIRLSRLSVIRWAADHW